MNAPIRNVKGEIEEKAKGWINESWQDSNKVDIDAQTWEPGGSDTWPWHEVVEKTVPPERGKIPYLSGISWEVPDVEIKLDPEFNPVVVYEQTYENNGDSDMKVTEDWSHAESILNERSIELDQGVSFGTEVTATAGFTVKALEIKGGVKSTMSMTLGAKESIKKTEKTEVHFGRSVTFTVPAGKACKVQYVFSKGVCSVTFAVQIKASGWVYFRTSYKSKPAVGIDPHVYPWKIYGEGPQGIGQPMPDAMRNSPISATYEDIKHLGGHFTLTNEKGEDITNQVQVVTAPPPRSSGHRVERAVM